MDENKDMYLEDLVEEWLFNTAAKLEKMEPGTDEYLLAVKAWYDVYQTWLDHKRIMVDHDEQELKRAHEKSLEKMKLVFGIITTVASAGVTWGGYAIWTKVMQVWEDKGHIPLGSALKSIVKSVKPPKV